MRNRLVIALLLSVAVRLSAAESATVIPHRQDKPPNDPYTPQESLQHMTVPPGFKVELVAGEPDLINPIAMTFDDRGRIWVTESIEYPRKSAGPGRDRVKLLEDTDGKGRADKVTVFADGLNVPTGVAVGYGGVWVLNSPDLLFLREKDGKEVSREVVVTGFGRTDIHELPNSLTWGPDGWLYGLNGVFNESRIRSNNGREYSFTCAMWRVHPRTREFQVVCEGTSNPYGVVWDSEGSAIVEACHWANDHLFHFVETGIYQRQAGAYPPFAMSLGSITDHGHQKTAYCGIACLDTDAYPAQYRNRIVVGNIHGGCINVDRIQRDGATYLAKGEPDLLNANDAWCMPVALKIGPDGCLYVLDWYDRYHCYQDANRDPDGIDRLKGRLYRLRYQDTPRAPKFDLASESDDQLIQRLASPNIFYRESSQRILSERLSAPDKLVNTDLQMTLFLRFVIRNSLRPTRLHALWASIGGGPLLPDFHQTLFSEKDPAFRAWAVHAAGNQGKNTPTIRNLVAAKARDPSPDVQLQVAIAAPKMEGVDALAVLVDVLAHCGHDKLIPFIAWQNLHPLLETEAGRLVELLNRIQRTSQSGGGSAWPPALTFLAPRLTERILGTKQVDARALGGFLQLASQDAEQAKECLAVVHGKLRELSEPTVAQLKAELKPMLTQMLSRDSGTPLYLTAQLLAARLGLVPVDSAGVLARMVSPESSDSIRLQALDALIAFRETALLNSLPKMLTNSSTHFLTQVFVALGRFDEPKLADVLLAQYPKLAPELQSLAIDLIMQREPWAKKLLNAVLEKRIPATVLNANHLRKIVESNDRDALWAVEKAYGKVREERNPEREKVVAEMGEFLREHQGSPGRGQTVFKQFCAQCHTIYGEGGKVGPDITSNGRSSFDQLLSNVFDPSLVIGPSYQVTTVVTTDGRNLTGLIAEDNDQRVVVRLPGEGEESVPRGKVKYTRASKLSMMPEGIETLLAKNDLVDLFAFLALDKPPTDPNAKAIPGSPGVQESAPPKANNRIKVEMKDNHFNIQARLPGKTEWLELASYVTDTNTRPYFHPLREPSGRVVLTSDRPEDHPWQHGIFTGFHGKVNGHEYWMENDGQNRFRRLAGPEQRGDLVSWTAFSELIDPSGDAVIEEMDHVTVHAPDSADSYAIDFDFTLRAKGKDVLFEKSNVAGLAIRMPWDKANPRQTHLNSNGERGSACEKKRANWCNVERPFGDEIFGIAVFPRPDNPDFPPAWRVDDQGLINPAITALSDWTLKAGESKTFRHRIVIYKGSAQAAWLEEQSKTKP